MSSLIKGCKVSHDIYGCMPKEIYDLLRNVTLVSTLHAIALWTNKYNNDISNFPIHMIAPQYHYEESVRDVLGLEKIYNNEFDQFDEYEF